MGLKVLFFGNHTVGVQVIKALRDEGVLVGVVAHPEDAEDGVIYESVYQHAKFLDVPTVRLSPKCSELKKFVSIVNPDLIWVTDYRYLLPKEIFSFPTYGSINLHPSLLPKYRGRASLNWALIHGEKEVGLTAHFIDEGVDTGDIIHQMRQYLVDDDYIGDVLEKIYPFYGQITKILIRNIQETGILTRQKQKLDETLVYPARKPNDGLIDFSNKTSVEVLQWIKALSTPYPGAFIMQQNKKIIIWRAKLSTINFKSLGINMVKNNIYLQCIDKSLYIENYTIIE